MKQEVIIKILVGAIITILILVIWFLIRINKIEKQINENILSAFSHFQKITQLYYLNRNELKETLKEENDQGENQNVFLEDQKTKKNQIIIKSNINFELNNYQNPNSFKTIKLKIKEIQKEEEKITVKIEVENQETIYAFTFSPEKFLGIFDQETHEIKKPEEIKGDFENILPQNKKEGEIIFYINSQTPKIILKVGEDDEPKFYEIDFQKLNYQETIIG